MNAAEHFICSSSLWRHLTGRKLLPWILGGVSLGDHLLEIGAGYGPATAHLQTRVRRITSLDYDHNSSLKLKLRNEGDTVAVVQGDAAQLPFACQTFSAALAILVLHHLKSAGLQDQMFAEAFRVLRPGGVFIAFEIPDNWLHRVGHLRSTFTPMTPTSAFPRLNAAGFSEISLDVRSGGFRFTAIRPDSNKVVGDELA